MTEIIELDKFERNSFLQFDIQKLRDGFRIGGLSMFDTLGTIGGAYIHSRYFGTDLTKTIIFYLIAGEVVHLALGIDTPITKFIL